MRFLIDADVLLKLARLDLLSKFTILVQETGGEIGWLHTAFYTLGLHKPASEKTLKRCVRKEVVDALVEFCAKHPPVELAAATLTELQRKALADLATTAGVDTGEAVLFVAALESDALLVTDDRRSLDAVKAAPNLEYVRKQLEGRWASLLQVISCLMRRESFETVKGCVVNDLSADTAVRAIFGSGSRAQEGAVNAALSEYMKSDEFRLGSICAKSEMLYRRNTA